MLNIFTLENGRLSRVQPEEVAAVALLPPTLIASAYGMNFRYVPELQWANGYLFALSLMAASVALPFWLFHHKGWLKQAPARHPKL